MNPLLKLTRNSARGHGVEEFCYVSCEFAGVLEQEPVAAGVDTTFRPWAHGLHVWPVFISAGIPESALAIEDLAGFFRLHARSDTLEETAS
jgi:hypothetical protein